MVATLRTTTGFEGIPAQEASRESEQFSQSSALALKAQEQHDIVRAEDATNRLRQKQVDLTFGPQGFANLKGADAVNPPVLKAYGDQFDKAAVDLGATLDNNNQKQLFANRAQVAGVQLREDIARHVAQQSNVYADDVFKSRINTEIQVAASRAGAPDAAAVPLLNIDNAIYDYARRNGKPQEWVDETKSKARSEMFSTMVDAQIVQNPVAAKALFDQVSPQIEPQQRFAMAQRVRAAAYPVESKNVANSIIGDAMKTATTDMSGKRVADIRSELGAWIGKADETAERLHPGDPVFRDMVEQHVKGYVSTIAAMYEGRERMAYQTLTDKALGIVNGGQPGARATTTDELLNTPEARLAWGMLEPNGQRGVIALLNQNARQATGEFLKSDPALFNTLRARLYLPDGNPDKITSPTQLVPYFAHGLNYADSERLRKEVGEANTPEGNPFLKQVNGVKGTASKMLTQSLRSEVVAHPELADEAAYRYGYWLDNVIKETRTKSGEAGVQELFRPGSPSYVLDPSRVNSFMPSKAEIASHATAQVAPAAATPEPVAVNPKTGERMVFRGGKWQKP